MVSVLIVSLPDRELGKQQPGQAALGTCTGPGKGEALVRYGWMEFLTFLSWVDSSQCGPDRVPSLGPVSPTLEDEVGLASLQGCPALMCQDLC